jgi:hypothetical protein
LPIFSGIKKGEIKQMIQFKQVKTSAIEGIEVDSGMLLKNFNIATPSTPADADILGITSGGFTFTANADYEDFGADIDNVPNGSKEFKRRTAWHVSLTTNLLDQNVDNIKFALGAKASSTVSELSGEDADGDHFTMNSITPFKNLKNSDFQDLYAAFNLLDGISWVIIKINNALSTGGYQLTTSKNGKGQTAITIEGHPTIEAEQSAPFTIYWGTLVPENEASSGSGSGSGSSSGTGSESGGSSGGTGTGG